MKKLFFSAKKIMMGICLLFTVGILFMTPKLSVHADERDSNLVNSMNSTLNAPTTGTTDTRTNINEPGSSENAEDLKELNVANSLTITYNNGNGTSAGPIRILLTLTLIALAPTILIMLTSFTRIIIVMHFTRAALNTNTIPPNQVIIGISLLLTFFIMNPVIKEINEKAVQPFDRGEIETTEFLERGVEPLREFMYGQTQVKDVRLFMEISDTEWDGTLDGIPTSVLIPSFMVSELRTAFIIGFLIYIPFIVIDMVVASILMSMGMMMLPPTTISLPIKILLFVLADGWTLIIGNVVKTFY